MEIVHFMKLESFVQNARLSKNPEEAIQQRSCRAGIIPGMTWPDWMLYQAPAIKKDAFQKRRMNALRDGSRQILAAINGISLLGPNEGVVWRGQAKTTWRLESKASRLNFTADEVAKHENEMITEARRLGIDNAQRMGDWEILARLRHHGAATRLIDCTSDPYIALWFLCEDDSDGAQEEDAVLLSIQRSEFTAIDSPYEPDNYGRMLQKDPARLIYSTPPIDPRIAAQRGLFILHSHPLSTTQSPLSEVMEIEPPTQVWLNKHREYLNRLCGMEDIATRRGRPQIKFPSMIGIVVPAAIKPMLLNMLKDNFGFNRSSIFPDFAGMGRVYESKQI